MEPRWSLGSVPAVWLELVGLVWVCSWAMQQWWQAKAGGATRNTLPPVLAPN